MTAAEVRALYELILRHEMRLSAVEEVVLPRPAIHFPEAQTPLEDCIRYPMPPDVRDER